LEKGYIVLTYEFHREGKRWVAYCKELGTSTFARSLTEAEHKLDEAISLHLNTLEDVGERERFFKEHNIQFHHTRPRKDVKISVSANRDIFVRPHIQPVRELIPA
jgi:predicted RNase H-like HicB family nuclease